MTKIWEGTQLVKASEVDAFYNMKVSEILNCMQDAASAHATQIGVGYQEMLAARLFWVLSWVRLEFSHFPTFGNRITIRTWPKCPYGMLSLRDFQLLTDGGEFCRASSGWLVVDLQSGKAVPLTRLPYVIPYSPEQVALDILPEKFNFTVPAITATRPIRYSDLDVNRHVNNARYAEFLMDAYPLEHHQNFQLQNLTISYLQESKFGNVLEIGLDTNSAEHLIEFRKNNPPLTVLRARATWKKRPL
jgi:acyl-ACP thioesterase